MKTDMVQQHPHPDHVQDGSEERRRLESRRRMLRRSLGAAAPVVLTLGSMPVSAGQCISASAFVSTTAFQSRQATYNPLPCLGLSPTEWAQRAPYWSGVLLPTRKFHQEFGSQGLSPGFNGNTTLLDALNAPTTIEAHVVAALLNAHRGGMTDPFDSPVNIVAIWANIRTNGGFFKPSGSGTEQSAMTPMGTLQWIALTWGGSGMSGTTSTGGTGTGTTTGTSTGSGSVTTPGNGNGNGNAYGKYK
jgi:hypothetical protein